MSTQNYAIIDSSNNILNIVVYAVGDMPPNPHPDYLDCTFVPCGDVGKQCDGWTYVDGQFVAPPVTVIEPLPSVVLTVSDLQAQLAAIQAQLNALLTPTVPAVNAVEPVAPA
jgi:hypothetical protein